MQFFRICVFLALIALCVVEAKKGFTENRLQWYFQNILDTDGDLRITREDLFNKFGEGPSKKFDNLIARWDLDNSRTIDFGEFVHGLRDPVEGYVQQVHLALTTDPTEMVVMWITRDLSNSTEVMVGTSTGVYTSTQKGTYTTYDVGLDGWSGWIYTVTLTGLTPSTKYFYICGSATDDNWSDEFNFTTAPSLTADQKNQQYTIAVTADMGTYIPMGWAVTDQMVNDMTESDFAFAIHAGDVCYAGTGSTWEIEAVWDIWGDQMQPLAGYIPYMFAVGNHEHYYNYTSFTTRYIMPGEQSEGNGNYWYSFDYGNAHYTFMSTEHPYWPGTPQHDWLVQDFEQANQNRAQRPWMFLSGHRPMYCSDTIEWSAHTVGGPLQVFIEPLLEKYSVDLYLSGHMHMYERTYPVLNGTIKASGNVYTNPSAPAHVVQATGGVFTDTGFVDPQPVWSAVRNDFWGYGKMTLNYTHLHYEFMHEETYAMADEFWIIKTN